MLDLFLHSPSQHVAPCYDDHGTLLPTRPYYSLPDVETSCTQRGFTTDSQFQMDPHHLNYVLDGCTTDDLRDTEREFWATAVESRNMVGENDPKRRAYPGKTRWYLCDEVHSSIDDANST